MEVAKAASARDVGIAALMSLVLLLAAGVASAQTSSIAIVHPGPVGSSAVPLAIAHEQGLFAKHGIDARLVAAGLGRVGVTDETPVGLFGVPVALRQAAQGTDVKVVATVATARVAGHLVAQPAIKTPQDLRGKRFGVSGIGAGLWINTILALQHLGLDPNRDNITMVEIGDLAKIARALEANTIDAAVLSAAQSTQLRAKGFSVLLDLQPANLSGPQPGLVVTGTYLRERPETVEKVLLAIVEAVAFTLAPANKATVLQTSMKVFGITDSSAAESGYQGLLRSLIRKPVPSLEPLRNMQRVMALHNAAVLNVRLEELVDDRLVRKLDESGAIDRLYAAYGVK